MKEFLWNSVWPSNVLPKTYIERVHFLCLKLDINNKQKLLCQTETLLVITSKICTALISVPENKIVFRSAFKTLIYRLNKVPLKRDMLKIESHDCLFPLNRYASV